jgi:LysM repeat protein
MKWWRILFGSLVFGASLLLVSAVQADTSYTIKRGDTLWAIARSYNLTPEEIAAVNPFVENINLIFVGNVLTIPTDDPPEDPEIGQGGNPYTIRAGDTLFSLARRNNTTVNAIMIANSTKIRHPNFIYAGDTITIPSGSGGGGFRRKIQMNRYLPFNQLMAHIQLRLEIPCTEFPLLIEQMSKP